jgi:hypothetical protein
MSRADSHDDISSVPILNNSTTKCGKALFVYRMYYTWCTQKHEKITAPNFQSLRNLKQTLCDSSVTRDVTCVCASVMQYLLDLKNPNLVAPGFKDQILRLHSVTIYFHTSLTILHFKKKLLYISMKCTHCLSGGWHVSWYSFNKLMFRVCQSVHHQTFNWINQQHEATSQVY